MSRRLVWCVVLLPLGWLLAGARPDNRAAPALQDPAPPLSLSVALPKDQAYGHRVMQLVGGAKDLWHSPPYGPMFELVITNTSKGPIKLWNHSSLSDYGMVSHELVDDQGRVQAITLNPRNPNQDNPKVITLEPGEHFIRPTAIGFEGWTTPFKKGNWNDRRTVRMRTIYEVQPSKEAQQMGIWTGRIQSPVTEYQVWGIK